MLSGAIGSAVKHPLVAGVDDATLRSHLVRLTRRLVDLPDRERALFRRVVGHQEQTPTFRSPDPRAIVGLCIKIFVGRNCASRG